MSLTKIRSFVGFSVKARKILFGVDNITTAIGKKKPYVVLVSTDISANSYEKLKRYVEKYDVEMFNADIEQILSGKNCKAIGLTDENLAKAVKIELKKEVGE